MPSPALPNPVLPNPASTNPTKCLTHTLATRHSPATTPAASPQARVTDADVLRALFPEAEKVLGATIEEALSADPLDLQCAIGDQPAEGAAEAQQGVITTFSHT